MKNYAVRTYLIRVLGPYNIAYKAYNLNREYWKIFSVQTFADAEKHAVLIIDEMSIKPGLQYDNSIVAVVGRPTMKLSGGFDSSHQKATHALVFMLCGISTKWKQTIGGVIIKD
ncbi:uncharacterized protein LOC112588600 [Harpegnathos saltator]|uniref:uncharacterized protein LOC112588600 n=1 Tax=Harpegnathos saltator TaxID=610380 RepID=UPI000DBED271|nr:uncharacterized protein LOC112588600 [Harpegnathos saltator]